MTLRHRAGLALGTVVMATRFNLATPLLVVSMTCDATAEVLHAIACGLGRLSLRIEGSPR